MKNIICAVLMVAMLVSVALAYGPVAKDSGQFKLGTMVATPSKGACVSQVKGRATQVKVTCSNSMFMKWTADNGSGTRVPVKRSYDNSPAGSWISSTGEDQIACGPGVKQVVFTNYTTNADKVICYEMQ